MLCLYSLDLLAVSLFCTELFEFFSVSCQHVSVLFKFLNLDLITFIARDELNISAIRYLSTICRHCLSVFAFPGSHRGPE